MTLQTSQQTIVLIDDSDAVRFALSEALTVAGYRVIPVAGGAAAVDMIGRLAAVRNPPSLFVIDLVMDDVNGFDVMATARRSFPQTPVLAISGGTRNIAPDLPLELAGQTGAAECLRKPFTNDALLDCVTRLCGPARA
jgi:CheY-like chemotaxis protein